MKKCLTTRSVILAALTAGQALPATRYVDGSVEASGNGQAWETAFQAVQEGIDASSEGDTVIVAEGTYVENIHFGGRNIILRSTDPLNPIVVENTIIDGHRESAVVAFAGTENETCFLSGFTVRNGMAIYGAGVHGVGTHAMIRNNVIASNYAVGWRSDSDGGGLHDCDGIIENNTVTWNWADDSGGGLYGCDGIIQNNTVTDNIGYSCGGGLADCQGVIQNNWICDNAAGWFPDNFGLGGGLYLCDGVIRNNVIVGNTAEGMGWATATSPGAGGALFGCDGRIENNTILRNIAYAHDPEEPARGGGLYACNGTIRNCIIWANSASEGAQLYGSGSPAYSCIKDWTGLDEGNIIGDPRFLDPVGPDGSAYTWEDNDYRLSTDSPCVDAGYNGANLPDADIVGMHRIMYGGKSLTVDMGAYEYYINDVERGPGADQATLTWSSWAGQSYSIFYSGDLLTWHLAVDAFPSLGNQTTSWIDDGSLTGLPPSLVPRRFYRILENQ